ncbi:MAG: hypothetical protein HYT80_09740 [Euryarchaeota archaeon]|nr:hypothetical protein [Euryarchaeota archaeon]
MVARVLLLVLAWACAALADSAAAQPPISDGAFLLEWLTPESAKAGTLVINATGHGNATLRVGFQPPTRSSSCVGGAFARVPVRYELGAVPGHARIDPSDANLPADHVPSSASPPATRWSGPLTFSTRLYLNETKPNETLSLRFSTGMPAVSGGSCTPGALSNVVAGRTSLDLVVPRTWGGPAPTHSSRDASGESPSLGMAAVLAVGAVALVRRP